MKTLSTCCTLSFVLVMALGHCVMAQDEIDTMIALEGEEGLVGLFDDIESGDETANEPVSEPVAVAPEVEVLRDPVKISEPQDDVRQRFDEALSQRDSALKARDSAAAESRERIRVLEQTLAQTEALLEQLQLSVAHKNREIEELQALLRLSQEATLKDRVTLAYNIGCVYKAGKQFTKAEAEFLKALEIDPDDAGVHYNLGVLYDDNLGDTKKAVFHYKRFLELAPEDADAPKVVEWMNALL